MGTKYNGKPFPYPTTPNDVEVSNVVDTSLTGSFVESTPIELQNLVNTTAGTAKGFQSTDALNPLAKERIIALKNSGDQPATVTIYPYLQSVGINQSNVSLQVTMNANETDYITNGQLNEVVAPFDSLNITVNYATLPTSGGISATIVEVSGN